MGAENRSNRTSGDRSRGRWGRRAGAAVVVGGTVAAWTSSLAIAGGAHLMGHTEPVGAPAGRAEMARSAMSTGGVSAESLQAGLVAGSMARAEGQARPAAAAGRVTPADSGGGSGVSPSPAFIGPLIKFLRFGDATGLPEGCTTGISIISTGATAIPGASKVAGPVDSAITNGCTQMSMSGEQYIDTTPPMVAPLAAINPYANPGIEAFANMVNTIATNYPVAPFGPFLGGVAQDSRWFEGTGS